MFKSAVICKNRYLAKVWPTWPCRLSKYRVIYKLFCGLLDRLSCGSNLQLIYYWSVTKWTYFNVEFVEIRRQPSNLKVLFLEVRWYAKKFAMSCFKIFSQWCCKFATNNWSTLSFYIYLFTYLSSIDVASSCQSAAASSCISRSARPVRADISQHNQQWRWCTFLP